jgi:predicted nucleic acid-binding protein
MRILVDTNILLDVLTKRQLHLDDSAKVWTLVHSELVEGYLSAISVNNLYYIVRKLQDRKTAEAFVDDILNDFEIASLTKSILKQARTVMGKDFEDSIQYFSAIQVGCEVLLTRNKKDFPALGLQILTPREFLQQLQKGISPTP